MPQQQGMLPILKHTCIYLYRDVQCIVIYMYIYLYTVCEGIQSRIIIPLFKNCERSEPEKIFENLTVASKASRSIWEKLAPPPPPPNCRTVKVRLFVFFTEEDILYIFSIFKVRIFISTKCQPPPPPQNQMVVPQLRTQNGSTSTSLGKKATNKKHVQC